ncbi:hypothetical protein GCM10020358_39390 [Amorphoplanes nipponensis]|uniref:Uncharacterized protein n=1 Tax=Actinoplanes nipponensis TaxID=135950 RepID=A0A919JJV8_9ACTN|nr:hypothetical protein [Actinoplanes nipponensis]GIE51023.1 hypothetical protein Ani05nite_45570 [Actinoplanes nipponensis]
MSDDRLKLVETCALLILLKEGQEIANADLKNERGLELKRDSRERLVKRGLVEVRKEGQRLFLNLSDEGWRTALEVIGSEPPPRAGFAGATIYAQVDAVRRYLQASHLALSDFYAPPGDVEPAPATGTEPTTDEVVAQIRKAYDGIAQAPGDAVKLVRIRAALPGDISVARVDEALTVMNRGADVRIFAEANQKTLTDADRAAAVTIGNQDKHLIVIK